LKQSHLTRLDIKPQVSASKLPNTLHTVTLTVMPRGQAHSNLVQIRDVKPHHHTTTVLWPFFQDYPGKPLP